MESPMAGPPATGRRRRWPWLLITALAAGALVAAAVLGGGSGSSDDRPALAGLVSAAEVADAGGAAYVRANPPVDLASAERVARASFGQIPLPDGRAIASWQRPGAGPQITQVVLHYADPAQVAQLDGVAMTMLPATFGLRPEALDLPDAQDARLWRAPNYQALTFRHAGFAVLLGTTDTADPDILPRLARQTLGHLTAAGAATATP
jgi:hypothetical protein